MLATLAAQRQAKAAAPGGTARAERLTLLGAVLDGSLYDALPHDFWEERNGAGEYVPLKYRRPSVRYNLCRLVVEDTVSLLFGEGRFPVIDVADHDTKELLSELIDESNFTEVMSEAAVRGSVGSIAVLMRVLNKRVFWTVMPTANLTPEWDPEEPDRLVRITERYQTTGAALRSMGYQLSPERDRERFWFTRFWDDLSETWLQPISETDAKAGQSPAVDDQRSTRHVLGFVPIIWIRNLPGWDAIDGLCTFEPAIETQIEIEYRLSQGGRALQYASDPVMMIRDPAGASSGDMVRSATNALILGPEGDAKMLEIDGAASEAVVSFCKALREIAVESIHGNRASPERLAAAQSGRAMELLNYALIGLVDRLRHTYGRAIRSLLQMVVMANAHLPLRVAGADVPLHKLRTDRMTLRWGEYFPATIHDKQMIGQTLGLMKRDGLISRESAVEQIAEIEGIADPQAELTRIAADILAADARAQTQAGVQVRAVETLEQ